MRVIVKLRDGTAKNVFGDYSELPLNIIHGFTFSSLVPTPTDDKKFRFRLEFFDNTSTKVQDLE